MSSGDELFVQIGGRDVGLQAILQKVDAEMQQSADSAVRLGQQYARLAQAQGQPALSSQILAGTIGQAGAASEKALLGIETQAARVGASSSYFEQFGQAAGQSMLSVVGPTAALTAGLGLLSAAVKETEEGFALRASLDADRKAIDIQLSGLRDTNVAFQQAAQYAATYKLTQQQTTEAIGAAIPVIRNSKASMDTILGTFDQLRVRSPEKSFQDAARALSELQAGQYTSLNKVFNVPLDDARKLSDEIKKGGDAVQLVSQYLTSVGAGMDVVAARATGAAGEMKDLNVVSEQLKLALGDDATGPGLLILQGRIRATQGLVNLLRGDTAGMAQGLRDAGVSFAASAAGATAYANAINSGQGPANALAAANAAAAEATNALSSAQVAGSGGGGSWATAEDRAAAAAQAATAAAQQQTTELQANAQAAVLDAAQKQAQKAATDQLTASTTQAVSAFLALNPTIDAAGIASAVAADKIPALIGQLTQLRIEAYSTRDAIAALAAQQGLNTTKLVGDVGIGAPGIASGLNNSVDAVYALQQANKKAADDQIAGDLAIARAKKDTAAEVRLLREQQQGLNKDSLAYKQIEAEIIGVERPKKGGGGTRLSDQQKLQNSLLASQDEYQQKSEDASTQYATQVENIYKDYYDKLRAAQKDFNQEQLDSRAGFYDQLGSIESGKIRQQASAAYEQASIEAGKIAQEKGADVANKYMQAQEQIISARAKRLSEIEKAEKDKDTSRAEYLRGVDAEYKKAEDAKLARIQEGEGSLAAERDKQLQDAADKEASAQDKIGTAADRAAERKITASERAGKKIDEETLKVNGLADSYDRLGTAGARTGITPSAPTGAPSPATPSSTPAAAAGVPADLNGLLAKLDEIRAAVADVVRATNAGSDKVAGALKVKIAN